LLSQSPALFAQLQAMTLRWQQAAQQVAVQRQAQLQREEAERRQQREEAARRQEEEAEQRRRASEQQQQQQHPHSGDEMPTLLSDRVVRLLLTVATSGTSTVVHHALLKLTKSTRLLVSSPESLPKMRDALVNCASHVLADPSRARVERFSFLPAMGACFQVLDKAAHDYAALPELGVHAATLKGLGTWRQFAKRDSVPASHVEQIKVLCFEKLFFA